MKETKAEEIAVTLLENKTYLKEMSVDDVLNLNTYQSLLKTLDVQ